MTAEPSCVQITTLVSVPAFATAVEMPLKGKNRRARIAAHAIQKRAERNFAPVICIACPLMRVINPTMRAGNQGAIQPAIAAFSPSSPAGLHMDYDLLRTLKTGRRLAPENMPRSWYLYILECAGGRLYTGITVDVEARYRAHAQGRGAKFTRSFPPSRILLV